MSITLEKKQSLISNFKRSDKDTGSIEVQVAILTERIRNLTIHLKSHSKDHSTTRGLLKLVGQRRRFLDYIKKKDMSRYEDLIKKLGIRR